MEYYNLKDGVHVAQSRDNWLVVESIAVNLLVP
jgi:hypothetical protein